MPWPEDIAGELPNPHPEEPATLRSDILDELHDHLLSAIEHEQFTETDEATARKSVLARFGNPSTIACRLWWDAMWGRIMMQRITLVFVALLCCCSIVATFLTWKAVENSQKAIEKSQQTTAALLEQVQKLTEREETPRQGTDERLRFLDWIPVSVNLKFENGDPVTDDSFYAVIESSGLYGKENDTRSIVKRPNDAGVIDFGFVKPGELMIRVGTPWKEFSQRSMTAQPGSTVDLTFVCPQKEPADKPVKFAVDWPAEIQRHGLWTHVTVSRASHEVKDTTWMTSNHQRGQGRQTWSLLIDPQGSIYESTLELSEETKRLGTSHLYLQDPAFVTARLFGNVVENGVRQDWSQGFAEELSHLFECRLIASLDQPAERLMLPECGVQIDSMIVSLRDPRMENESTVSLQPLLGLDLPVRSPSSAEASSYSRVGSDDWAYHPSKTIVELVRFQLQQFEAREKRREEIKAEKMEASAE